ncbi:MAG: GNAT family N-acetyltransferase [Acidobacteriota bacterium]|nr:GNAT family N-acetyltransferase [Acidobacteriota bacterium]
MSVPAVRVRPGRPADADALRSIRLEALADSPEAFGDSYEECLAWDEAQWRARADEWNFYLAEVDGRVVGMARGESHEGRPGTRWLFAMYVSPSARGGDVARRLVDTVSAWAVAEGVDALHLYVSSSMSRAKAFYVKSGFAATGLSVSGRDGDERVFEEMRRPLEESSLLLSSVAASSLYDLRRRVLREGDASVDVRNPGDEVDSTLHVGGTLMGRVVVGASFFAVPAPFRPDEGAYQLRYMASDFDVQGHGLGARLLDYALADLSRRGAGLLWANARTSAIGFYTATGWSVRPGSLHVSAETGIDHVIIHRALGPDAAAVD